MLYLVPSVPNALGLAWLVVHLHQRALVEEAALESRFGSVWHEYAGSGVHRWLSNEEILGLVLVVLLCGCWARDREARVALDASDRGAEAVNESGSSDGLLCDRRHTDA